MRIMAMKMNISVLFSSSAVGGVYDDDGIATS